MRVATYCAMSLALLLLSSGCSAFRDLIGNSERLDAVEQTATGSVQLGGAYARQKQIAIPSQGVSVGELQRRVLEQFLIDMAAVKQLDQTIKNQAEPDLIVIDRIIAGRQHSIYFPRVLVNNSAVRLIPARAGDKVRLEYSKNTSLDPVFIEEQSVDIDNIIGTFQLTGLSSSVGSFEIDEDANTDTLLNILSSDPEATAGTEHEAANLMIVTRASLTDASVEHFFVAPPIPELLGQAVKGYFKPLLGSALVLPGDVIHFTSTAREPQILQGFLALLN